MPKVRGVWRIKRVVSQAVRLGGASATRHCATELNVTLLYPRLVAIRVGKTQTRAVSSRRSSLQCERGYLSWPLTDAALFALTTPNRAQVTMQPDYYIKVGAVCRWSLLVGYSLRAACRLFLAPRPAPRTSPLPPRPSPLAPRHHSRRGQSMAAHRVYVAHIACSFVGVRGVLSTSWPGVYYHRQHFPLLTTLNVTNSPSKPQARTHASASSHGTMQGPKQVGPRPHRSVTVAMRCSTFPPPALPGAFFFSVLRRRRACHSSSSVLTIPWSRASFKWHTTPYWWKASPGAPS